MSSYNNGYSEFYGKELNILSEMDEAKIPNYNAEDIFPEFYKQSPWAWDGHLYGVPVIWGVNSVVYNPSWSQNRRNTATFSNRNTRGSSPSWTIRWRPGR